MILREGNKGSAVATIQEWLNELGYKYSDSSGEFHSLVVDGIFGPNTEEVVLLFQTRR